MAETEAGAGQSQGVLYRGPLLGWLELQQALVEGVPECTMLGLHWWDGSSLGRYGGGGVGGGAKAGVG